MRQKLAAAFSQFFGLSFLFSFFTVSLFFSADFLYAQETSHYYHIAQKIGDKAVKAGLKRIAILPFRSDKPDLQDEARYAADDLLFFLVENPALDIIERTEIDRLLEEKSLSQTGLFEKNKKSIGKWLKADALLFGNLSRRSGNQLTLQLRLVDVGSAKISASFIENINKSFPANPNLHNNEPSKIQVAILLDTSSSMQGLINQTRAYLWKMVNELALAKKGSEKTNIEIALYEYGNSGLSMEENFLKMVLPFSSDLDKVSERLFVLSTNGGEEYAGAVIRHAVENLSWSKRADNYRAIFIAGNEGFNQGKIDSSAAIKLARNKGIYVNTIFCGSKQMGEGTGWLSAANEGNGIFSTIDQNHLTQITKTPFDEKIRVAGYAINETYIPYGKSAMKSAARQKSMDQAAESMPSSGADIERFTFKGKAQYSTQSWDLVNKYRDKELKISNLDKSKLPDQYRKLNNAELEKVISKKLNTRKKLQSEIQRLEKERQKFLAKEQSQTQSNSLDNALTRTVRHQAHKQKFIFGANGG